MKPSLFITTCLAILFTTHHSKGQEALTVGNYMLGAGFSLNFSNSDDEGINSNNYNANYFRVAVSSSIGKLIKENLAVGAGFTTSIRTYNTDHRGSRYTSDERFKEYSAGLNIFLRRFWSFNDKLGAFINPSFGYSRTSRDSKKQTFGLNTTYYNELNYNRKSNIFHLGAGAGIYYFFNDHFSVHTTLANINAYKSFSSTDRFDLSDNESTTEKSTANGLYLRLVNNFSSFTISYFF